MGEPKQGHNILVVDKEKPVLVFLKEILQEWGYHVKAACGPREAMPLLEKYSFDLILADLLAASFDGFGFYRHIKALNLSTPVLVMTTYQYAPLVDKCLEQGAAGYLIKPFRIQELMERVKQAVRVRQKV